MNSRDLLTVAVIAGAVALALAWRERSRQVQQSYLVDYQVPTFGGWVPQIQRTAGPVLI